MDWIVNRFKEGRFWIPMLNAGVMWDGLQNLDNVIGSKSDQSKKATMGEKGPIESKAELVLYFSRVFPSVIVSFWWSPQIFILDKTEEFK